MRRRELICSLGALALTKGLGSASSRATVDDQASSTGAAQQMEARIIAGVRLVDSRLAKAANDLARSVSPPYLYNHAVRTFLFASLAGTATGQKFDAEMLYLACILHDLGLTEKFQGELPFEIQGAEAAKRFLEGKGYESSKAAVVWDGIAMHASMIGHFKQPEVSLVGVGAGADVGGPDLSQVSKRQVKEILASYPRLEFTAAFLKTCADVVGKHPGSAGRSFMRDIGERYVTGYKPRNFCDAISEAPFADTEE
jgi:hypothetical protein